MVIYFRDATKADSEYIAGLMRQDDRNEVAALKLTPLQALEGSRVNSDFALTGVIDHRPALMFGYSERPLYSSSIIWALGTDECYRAPFSMVKLGRAFVAQMLERIEALENYCDARNVKSLKWLKLLGFTIGDPEPYGPEGRMFCRIAIRRNNICV